MQKDRLFDPFCIANPSLARVLWCIGERGFVLGLESGMAIEEERDRGGGEEENAKIAVLSGSEKYIAGRTESPERERESGKRWGEKCCG
jgi:hypothetical protein